MEAVCTTNLSGISPIWKKHWKREESSISRDYRQVYQQCASIRHNQYHIQRSSEEEITVPVVVAIVSPCQPAYELSIKPFDIQENGEETAVPVKHLHMDWVPYILPDKKRDAQEAKGVIKSVQVLVLGSTQSRAPLKPLKEEGSEKLPHYMPYLDHKEEEDHWSWVELELPRPS